MFLYLLLIYCLLFGEADVHVGSIQLLIKNHINK